jgi:hypothetical protein
MHDPPDGATLLAVPCSHYGCMVDMLCRWRRLLRFWGKISFHPNEGVWGAILSGCRRREGNLKLAAKVIDRLLEMQPERAAGHLVLLFQHVCWRWTVSGIRF